MRRDGGSWLPGIIGRVAGWEGPLLARRRAQERRLVLRTVAGLGWAVEGLRRFETHDIGAAHRTCSGLRVLAPEGRNPLPRSGLSGACWATAHAGCWLQATLCARASVPNALLDGMITFAHNL